MERLIAALGVFRGLFQDSALLFALAVGIAFAMFTFAGLFLIGQLSSPARRRLAEAGGASSYNDASGARKIHRSTSSFSRLFLPNKAEELGKARQRIIHAGYRGDEALTVFYLIRTLLALALAAAGGVVAFWFFRTDTQTTIMAVLGGAMLGLLIPSYILDKKVAKRKEELVNAFPDVLDLLVACTESGLGLNSAIQRVARETRTMYPVLSQELELVNSEIRSGVDRAAALRGLATRTGVEEIGGFVSTLSQSVRFGTSIANTMRIYAEEFRDKRMARAEERAATVSTKLIFPLVLCIFPSFFAVAIGPVIVQVLKVFGNS